MGRSAKRAAPTAASQRPAKKRKSAESSLAKIKEIADAEDAFSDDEKQEVRPLLSKHNAADRESESEGEAEEGFVGHDIVTKDASPVVAPGFRLWKTDSRLASKGELSQAAQYDAKKDQYSHFLKVNHNEEFTLVPLTITAGPYKGRCVFMLEPTKGFRFNDFPAEIRNHIYSFLVEADDCTINMRTAKRVHEARRPVMGGQTYNTVERKWEELPTLFSTLLRTSKQIFNEAAPILYGSNHFYFHGLGELKVFIDRVGSMRKYLRHIHIGPQGFHRNKAQVVFRTLRDATDLRSFTLDHSNICQEKMPHYMHTTTSWYLTAFMEPMLRSILIAHRKSEPTINVLDIVKIGWARCHKCKETAPAFPEGDDGCGKANRHPYFASRDCATLCKNCDAHCKELEDKIRKLFASKLHIED